MALVTALHRYPVKSCAGQPLTSASLDRYGFVGDRRFLIVDEAGNQITQRQVAGLALVKPEVVENSIRLAAPGVTAADFALPPPDAESRTVQIWSNSVQAIDLCDDAAAWVSEVVGKPARIVTNGNDFSRPLPPEKAKPGEETVFADAYPLLIISASTLNDLNDRLETPVPMNRFRPNIVVADTEPYAEDTWKRIRIGDVIMRAGGPCARCIIPTIDQHTLDRGKEPIRTLATYRRSADGNVHFGQNYINESTAGTIELGMTVDVLE